MKFFAAAAAAILALPLLTLADSVAYDETYDGASNSLDTVACSDGSNGLEHLGYMTFGSLPSFPYIGAAAAVEGWNSAQCGTCWAITYEGTTINMLAIDHAGDGFNLSLEAMDALTGGLGKELGRVDASAVQVDKSVCGL